MPKTGSEGAERRKIDVVMGHRDEQCVIYPTIFICYILPSLLNRIGELV